jgi:hypothetical protein
VRSAGTIILSGSKDHACSGQYQFVVNSWLEDLSRVVFYLSNKVMMDEDREYVMSLKGRQTMTRRLSLENSSGKKLCCHGEGCGGIFTL